MHNKRKVILFVALLAIVVLTAVACGPTSTPAPATTAPTAASQPTTAAQPTTAPQPTAAPKPTTAPTTAPAGVKVLRINLATYPDSIDPQKASFVNEIAVLQLAYEGLVDINEKNEITPGAADKWQTSPDGLTMTFHIRDGLKRADGAAMNARDYEYALKREVDPRVPGKQYTSIMYDVKGAEDLDNADPKKTSDADIQKMFDSYGVKALDDSNLQITFAHPVGFWQYIAYTWVTYPSDKKQVDKDPDNWWTKADGHNGNGPYKIQSIEEQKRIILVPNPNYWGAKPKVDRIELLFITDSAQSFDAYKKGELDINVVAAEDLNTIQSDANLSKQLLKGAAAAVFYLGFQVQKKPFDDPKVRYAFGEAFDRTAWNHDVLKDTAVPYTSWLPPGLPGADPKISGPATDQKKAKADLIAAGYGSADGKSVDCNKLGQIKLTYSSTPRNNARFAAMASYFSTAFSCPIVLDPVDPTVYTSLLKDVKTAPQVFYLGWIQDYPHPQDWLSITFNTVNGIFSQRQGYKNPTLDKCLADADATLDLTAAVAKYQTCEKMLLDDVVIAPVSNEVYYYLVAPYVNGPKDHFGVSDAAWPGQFGPIATYDVDLSKVGPGYPTK